MKIRDIMFYTVILVIMLLSESALFAIVVENDDKSLSPYFIVKSDNPEVDRLPLQSTSAKVNIAGVIADVTVTQVYKNDGKNPIEAEYIFPASTRAAVYAMQMTIGKRTIVAKIERKEDARKEYETAKAEGRSASLLEQKRPNVFSMNVANILPGDQISVEMKYTELLAPEGGIYSFVYPTVVGPRYDNQGSDDQDSESWTKNPYLEEGKKSETSFDMQIRLAAGLPIQHVKCATHKNKIEFESHDIVNIDLDSTEKNGGNRDFILEYQLAGGQTQSGLLLYEGEDENFFLLMVQPPKSVETSVIPPREYVFIVDVSGSMHGFPMEVSISLLKDLIGNLRPDDTFNVLTFSGGSNFMADSSIPATEENIQKAIALLRGFKGGGSTELLPALQRALDMPAGADRSRTFIVVTDGYVQVEHAAFDLIRKNLGKANLFAFGIGSSVNRYIIEGMARAGMGEPFIITGQQEAAEKAKDFRQYIQSPVLTGISVDYEGFDTHAVEPLSVPDVLSERPVIVFGKYNGEPEGSVTVRGSSGIGEYIQTFKVKDVKPLRENAALRYLWARHRIAMLADYNRLRNDKEIIETVTQMGLKYNLLTDWTSFVAVDSEIRVKDGNAITVRQPLPLPQGVPQSAVCKSLPSRGFAPRPSCPTSSGIFAKNEIKDFSVTETDKEMILEEKQASNKALVKIQGIVAAGGKIVDARSYVESRLTEIQKAYTKLLIDNPKLKGKIVVELTLDSSGKVTYVEFLENELKQSSLSETIKREFLKYTFRNPEKASVKLTISLEFSPI